MATFNIRAHHADEALDRLQKLVPDVPPDHVRVVKWVFECFAKHGGFDYHINEIGESSLDPSDPCDRHRREHSIAWSTNQKVHHVLCLRIRRGTYDRDWTWTLLHELGHLRLGDPWTHESQEEHGVEGCPSRERAAWEEGWKEALMCFPAIVDDGELFEARMNRCLAEYENRCPQGSACTHCHGPI